MTAMSTPNGARRGGIDLGGTKIQAVVVDDGTRCSARRATRPRPTGGPAAVAAAMAATLRGGGRGGRASRPTRCRRRRRLARRRRRRARAPSSQARNLPGWEGAFPLGATRSPRPRHAGRARQRRPGRHRRRVPARRRPAVPARCSACSGAPASAAASCSTAALDRPRRGGRDRPRRRAHRRRALRLRAPRLHGGLRRPRVDGAPGARRRTTRARRPSCSRSWSSAAATRLTSGVWARALDAGRQARDPPDRRAPSSALGAGVASAKNLLDVEADHHRRRPRHPPRRALRRAHRARRCCPTCSTTPTRRRCSVAALGDLGGAIGAALLAQPAPERPV